MRTEHDPAILSCSIESPSGIGRNQERIDDVAVEAPLEVRFAGKAATVLMRTPGEDEDLVRGFLFNEGIIAQARDVLSMRRPEGLSAAQAGNVIDVHLAGRRGQPSLDRSFYSNASCGVCGKRTIESLAVTAARVESSLEVSREVLCALPARLKASQPTFARTGGVHASGLFTPEGALVAVREDVGRHNALDKLVGWALDEDRVPLDAFVLVLSGRVSYELVQKAAMATIPVVAAVGAPSSLAVEIAQRFGITLVGFLRSDAMNVYAHAGRIVPAG